MPTARKPPPNAHTLFSKMPLFVYPRQGLYKRFRTYAHCKDTPPQTQIRGSKKCPSVYANFRVSTCFHTYAHCKGHPLQTHIRGSQKCPSVYSHFRVSIHASIHMPTARAPLPKRTCVVLKNARCVCPFQGLYTLFHTYAHSKDTPLQTHICGSQTCPLCMTMPGSIYMLQYKCPLQGHLSPNAHKWFSKMPLCVCPCQGLHTCFHIYARCKDTPLQTHISGSQKCPCVCPYQGIYTCFHTYSHCKNTTIQMHIRSSQKCPSVYAHSRVSVHASIHMPTARTPLPKRTYVVLKNAPLCMPM